MGAFMPAAVAPPADLGANPFTPGLDMKSVLLQMFKQRQGGFGERGLEVPGTGTEIPNYPDQTPDAKTLPGGGMAWGFLDPKWGQTPPTQYNLIDAVAQAIEGKHKGDPNNGPVHGGPAQGDPVLYDPTAHLTPPPEDQWNWDELRRWVRGW